MKKTALLLVIALTLALMPHTALAATSGKCGDYLYWSLNSSAYTLNLTGAGAMYDYSAKSTPWYSYKSQITHISIPNGVTYIGTHAFDGIPLKEVVIPDTVTEMGEYAFANNSLLGQVTWSANLNSIPNLCFYYCTNIKPDPFPEGLKSIGEHAFESCNSIGPLVFSEGLVSIGMSAFALCPALESVSLPSTLKTLGGGAFSYCRRLAEVNLSEGLETIGNGAFRSTAVSAITIPASVISISGNPFPDCPNLETVSVAEGSSSYRVVNGVLYDTAGETLNCYPPRKEGTDFTIPATVKSIGSNAFYGAPLTRVDIPEGVTSIGSNAFTNCAALTRLSVPASATDIGAYLLGTTMDVSGITVRLYAGSAMETYLNSNPYTEDSYVSRGIQIEYLSHRDSAEFVLPEDVTVIGEEAFEHIDAVSVNIPDGAASIGNRAFADCQSIEWIWIPESVTDISATAFAGDTLTIYGVSGSAAETFAQNAGITFVAEE